MSVRTQPGCASAETMPSAINSCEQACIALLSAALEAR